MLPVVEAPRRRRSGVPGQHRHHARPSVAAAALAAGATIVNDVSAGRADPDMLGVVADARRRATSRCTCRASRARCSTTRTTTTSSPRSATSSSSGSTPRARPASPTTRCGRSRASASARPPAHNLELLARLAELVDARRRAGARRARRGSRSSARLLGDDGPAPTRDDGTLATVVWAVDHGARDRARARRRAARRRAAALLDGDGRASTRRRVTTLRGRWAQGLEPRVFCWIIKDRLAASERPGGFARNHRKVRRQEELIWLDRARLHARPLAARLAAQPARLRRGRASPYEHVPLGRHDEWPDAAAASIYAHARALARRSRRSAC